MSDEYKALVGALKSGPVQPWQRDASFPDVGSARACLGCSDKAQKLMRALHLKPYTHTCEKETR